jgi:chromosome segregation ATPase
MLRRKRDVAHGKASNSMSSDPKSLGPLAEAAAAFERELNQYARITAELNRTTVRSQKTLSRTQKLLVESTECEEALGVRLRALLEAMNGARDTQQQCMEQTLEAARGLQARANEFTALLERVAALGTRARETSEPAARALAQSSSGDRDVDLVRSLEELGERMVEIIAEADTIAQDAEAGDWPDIARDVKSLKQQIQAAHGRVVQACSSVSGRVLS